MEKKSESQPPFQILIRIMKAYQNSLNFNCLFVFLFNSGKKTSTSEILATVTKAGRTPNAEENDYFEMVPVLIPSVTPTMKSCRCIKITYQVKVS